VPVLPELPELPEFEVNPGPLGLDPWGPLKVPALVCDKANAMETPTARSTTKPMSVRSCALRLFPRGGEGGSHCKGEGSYPGTPVSLNTGEPISQ
jgi:hypothetical protein